MVRSQVYFVPQEIMQLTFSIKSLKNCHGTQCRPKLNPNRTLKQPTWSLSKLSRSDLQPWRVIWRILKANLEPKLVLRRVPWKFHVCDFPATLLFTSYSAHVLITIQVPGLWWGKNWNQNTSKKRSWLIFRYVLGSVFVAQPSKVSRNRQKTWQRREKKQATWKDNKYQQTKKEMERATRSKRKTNVTILWWICWSWRPQKLNSLGSMLASVGFDDHTRGTGRQNVATSPDSAQKRPNGTFSPSPSVKEN